jgi:hypothetical protein
MHALLNLPESDMACRKACAKRDENAKSTGAEVENALRGRDTSDLKVSFRQALSFSIPPLTRYRYYRPGGYSNLILGVPLVDQVKNEDNVPKVMRMCIAEIENRGLNVDGIYPVSLSCRVLGLMLILAVPFHLRHRRTEGLWHASHRPIYELTQIRIQLRHRFENENSFSFSSTDNIHSVTALLRVSYCNHFNHVNSLSSFLALPLVSSRTTVSALLARV